MSRIYFKPFTFKKVISFVFLGLGCFIFNNNAHSETVPKIVGHYYVAKDKTNMKYDDRIQWEVTSYAEWSKFMVNLQTMPKDNAKDNPMGLRQPEVIHFNVTNPDQKSGHDIFISQEGIQQFSRMPVDIYYAPNLPFREFLESELSSHPGYDTTTANININAPGIVVIYRGSSQLNNPHWVVDLSETTTMERYKNFFSNLRGGGSIAPKDLNVDNSLYENEGTFIIYLNYPAAPQQIMVVGTNGSIRGTKIEPKYYYYKDRLGYFSMFKRQAEDNLRAALKEEELPEVRRKREAGRVVLF